MGQLIRLGLQRFRIFRITVSQRLYPNACGEIQILFSFHIIKPHAFPMIQDNLIPVVGVQNIFFAFSIYSFSLLMIILFLRISKDRRAYALVGEDLQQKTVADPFRP